LGVTFAVSRSSDGLDGTVAWPAKDGSAGVLTRGVGGAHGMSAMMGLINVDGGGHRVPNPKRGPWVMGRSTR